MALERVGGVLRMSLSPASGIYNHTATGGGDATQLEDAMPPEGTGPAL